MADKALSSSRRDFLKSTLAASLFGAAPAFAAKRSATDWVTLGNSGVKVTRLALGTGTFGGRVPTSFATSTVERLQAPLH